MTDKHVILQQLVTMSRSLGRPENDYVIIAEGNTSALVETNTFWIKASGTRLETIDEHGFVEVTLEGILDLIKRDEVSDTDVKEGLRAATVNRVEGVRPSLETMLHAVAYELTPARYIGHTHPTAVNAILCSKHAEEAVAARLFPDEVTVCGRMPLLVPYADPGVPLARAFRRSLIDYLETYQEPPRVVLLKNHGFAALGSSPQDVENITAMYVKAARILLGAYALGGPQFLTQEDVDRIHTRPDEQHRVALMQQLQQRT
jgi:rhamnose utilization protein RhaD (predicted bifunctional aldolase and dehydrogenase)